jgi:hypothetical protein
MFVESLTLLTQGGAKMVRKDFIISKTRTYLRDFVDPVAEPADKPRRRFLRQILGAILFSGSLVVTELSHCIRDKCTDSYYTIKRLLNHMVSARGDLTAVVGAYRTQMNRYIEPETLLVLDLTDLAKPRARKMKYIDLVRDGSEDKLVAGYWCTEVYACAKGKRIIPLALDVFSIQDPSVGSQNLRIEQTIDQVHTALNGKGIWVADRGFDGLNMYETWFSRKCQFVVRQRGDRCVVTKNGVRIVEKDLVERLRQQWVTQGLAGDIVFCKVTLPDHEQPLYLVAHWQSGCEKPLILLTTMVVENRQQAQQVIGMYKKRWSCEEAIQFLKGRVGLERFRVRQYEAIQRLAILAMLAMGFLTWVLLRSRQLTKYLFSLTSRFRKERKFVYYRLLDGLQQLAKLRTLAFTDHLLEPLEKG